MNDLIGKLRKGHGYDSYGNRYPTILDTKAADEIERLSDDLDYSCAHAVEMSAEIDALSAEIGRAEDTLHQIKNWCRAYPRTVFIEPTEEQWAEANKVLDAATGCPSLTAISGSNMRHVVEGIQEIIDAAPVSGRRADG